jgi:hypothetical protein
MARSTVKLKAMLRHNHFWLFTSLFFMLVVLFFAFPNAFGSAVSYDSKNPRGILEKAEEKIVPITLPPLDTALYDKKMEELANNPPPPLPTSKTVKDPQTGEMKTITVEPKPLPPNLWPVKGLPYPNAGALLPFNRIVAYYGNLYSTKMGVLGQYAPDDMLSRLKAEVAKWNAADPETPAIPALHYIAVVAQASAGADGKYKARMPFTEIDKVIALAEKVNGIVFLDIQVGLSTLEKEVPLLEKYLKMPQVHLGIDPEFSMKTGVRPGKVIGTYDAKDVNFTANYLAKLVKENNLPPKILIVHRFTQAMVTNVKAIEPLPEVQIIMDMDGWGGKAKKFNTYRQFVRGEPVQFTGFKLFYKNDVLEKGTTLLTPLELLKLNPRPIYIQFQ